MIGYIKGTIEEIYEDSIIVDRNGIGFRIYIPSSFLSKIYIKDYIKVYTYLNVKEDSLTLYGFLTNDELTIFKLLIGVNGVGPKVAVNILSFMSADEFKYAILAADEKKLSQAPGIGKKTAQKILLELKDKFDFSESFDVNDENGPALDSNAVSEAAEGLIGFGYSAAEALKAVKQAAVDSGSDDPEKLLKLAFKYL